MKNTEEAHKQGIKYQMQVDIDKMDMAIGLLSEVHERSPETSSHFLEHLENADKAPSTETTAGTVPMKLARCISEVKGIKGALEYVREKV